MDKKFVACMFIDNGKAVKSFTDHTIIFDDPVRLAEQYSDDDADALLLFDVSAGENHIQSLLLYKDICDVVNIPVYGGGHINSAEDVADLFTAGCEKVVLNFGKECHDLLRQVADAYGRNRIAVSIASADNIVINKAILEENASELVLIDEHALKNCLGASTLPCIVFLPEISLDKLLSMMEKRLKLSKRLLNPSRSTLIVTIDEKEYLHLGCLLEEMFPEANVQMVSSIIAQKGVYRKDSFYRTNEYLIMVQMGESTVVPLPLDAQWQLGKNESAAAKGIVWSQLRRSGTGDLRTDSPNLFYPIKFNRQGTKIVGFGEALFPLSEHPSGALEVFDDYIQLWPIKESGIEGRWQLSQSELAQRLQSGYVKTGKMKDNTIPVSYLKRGSIQKIDSKDVLVIGHEGPNNTVIVDSSDYKHEFVPGSQWNIESHDATYQGSQMINKMFGEARFSFPKSLYAVHDTIRFFVANKPNALIIDFFAGSGTTLHAVNLLNAEDGGHRRCIMVTNNEVSEAEAKTLTAEGHLPGDEEWDKLGIARYVTWPRTVCSIEGHDVKGEPLTGNYLGSDLPMADGFRANAAFFQLGFLDKTAVSLGMQFKEMLPVLWMKAGCVGKCHELADGQNPDMLILPENRFAVLVNEQAFAAFEEALAEHPEIQTVFLATDYEVNYRSMVKNLNVEQSYQLYRDYLDHFRLSAGRN